MAKETFGGWGAGPDPNNYRGGGEPPGSYDRSEEDDQVISLQTILDNSIHHHRIISLHQAVWIQMA